MSILKEGVKYVAALVGKSNDIAVELNQPTEYVIKRIGERVQVRWYDKLVMYDYKDVKWLIKNNKWDISWYQVKEGNFL